MKHLLFYLFSLCIISVTITGCKEKKISDLQQNISLSLNLPTSTVSAPTLAGPSPTPGHSIKDILGDKMVVATAANYPPWETKNQEEELYGFDIALIQEVGKRGGVDVLIQDVPDFQTLLPLLQEGKVHIVIAAIRPSPKRREQVDFTQYYYFFTQSVISGADIPIKIKEPKEITSYSVGVQKDTPLDSYIINELIKPGIMPLTNLNRYNTQLELMQAVAANQVVLGLVETAAVKDTEMKDKVKILLSQQIVDDGVAIAVRKGATALLQALNQIIEQLLKDGTVINLERQYLSN